MSDANLGAIPEDDATPQMSQAAQSAKHGPAVEGRGGASAPTFGYRIAINRPGGLVVGRNDVQSATAGAGPASPREGVPPS